MNNSSIDFYKYYSDRSSITPNSVNNGNKIKKTFNREYRTLNCLGKGGLVKYLTVEDDQIILQL